MKGWRDTLALALGAMAIGGVAFYFLYALTQSANR